MKIILLTVMAVCAQCEEAYFRFYVDDNTITDGRHSGWKMNRGVFSYDDIAYGEHASGYDLKMVRITLTQNDKDVISDFVNKHKIKYYDNMDLTKYLRISYVNETLPITGDNLFFIPIGLELPGVIYSYGIEGVASNRE